MFGVELKNFRGRQFFGFTPPSHGLIYGMPFQTDGLAAFGDMIKQTGYHNRKTRISLFVGSGCFDQCVLVFENRMHDRLVNQVFQNLISTPP